MNRILLLASALVFAHDSFAAPCVSGSLASYVALGSAGCTISNHTFSDFRLLSTITGATAILPTAVSLSPLGGEFDPGIQTSVNVTASAGTLLEAIFTYRVSGSAYVGSAISLANATSSGNGAVTYLQDTCAGGSFGSSGVTGCTGVPVSLATVAGVQASDSRLFNTVSFLSATDDFTFDGGLTGSANGGTAVARFVAIPEPFTPFLTCTGLLFIVGRRFRSTIITLFR